MGLVRDILSKSVDFYKEEIAPFQSDLIKAGLIKPDKGAYDAKSSLIDPWAYGSMAYGYKEKYSLLSYEKCRQITYADPIVAAIIQLRTNQVASFKNLAREQYDIGWRIKMRDKDSVPKEGDEKIIKELETFIMHCGVPENFEDTPELKRRDGWDTFLRKITRDTLSFDQINFEIIPRNDGKPYAFFAVDPATIKLIPDLKERVERFSTATAADAEENTWVQPFDTSNEFKEFKPESPKFAQVINGVKRHVYDEWEMAFGVRNPRTDLAAYGYGFSEIEMLVTTITSHMNAETYNRKFFSQGSTIKGVMTFEGSVPPDQLDAFRRQWYAQSTGVNNAWRTPIMALGAGNKLNWTSLQLNNREMEFGKWLEYCIKTICGVFLIDPIEIGFDISKQGAGQQGNGGGGLNGGNQSERMEFSKDKGLRPILAHIETLLNEYIVWRLDPNYEFEFVGLNADTEKDEFEQAEKQVKSIKTIDEVRAEWDLPPLPSWEKMAKKGPGALILDSSLINLVGQQIQAAQAKEDQENQMAMQGGGGDQPGGIPGQDQSGGSDQSGGGLPGQGTGQPPGQPGQSPGDENQEPEPDYENMDLDELNAELEKLQGGGGENSEGGKKGGDLNQANAQQKQKPEKAPKPDKTKKSFVKQFFEELNL